MSGRPVNVTFHEAKIDEIFASVDQCHRPGAAVGIAIGGKPVYRKGFGLANMELPAVLTPSMRMRIGSATKHVTCLTYMLLCEEGKAHIDDPVGRYLPEVNAVARSVTIRQLMTHTGGLRDAANIRFQFSGLTGAVATTAELIALYTDISSVNAPPGTTWMYSNGGYVLLSEVIERISGQPLGEAMRSRIFDRLCLWDTSLRRWDNNFVANSATPHMMNSSGEFERPSWGLDFSGGGALVSTVDDMLRWLAHMDAPVVGSRSTWHTMKSPQRLANGSMTGYGLGLVSGEYRGVETLYHIGGWLGAGAQMLKVPSAGLDIIVMVNRHDVSAPLLVDQILDACLTGLDPHVEQPAAISGTFVSPTTGRVLQLSEKNARQIAALDGYTLTMQADAAGILRVANPLRYVKQSLTLRGPRARPSGIGLNDFGNLDELTAMNPASKLDRHTLADQYHPAGHYRSDIAGVAATIVEAGTGWRLITSGRFGSMTYDQILPLTDAVWLAKPAGEAAEWFGAILTFGAEGFTFRSYAIPTPVTFRRA